MPGGASVRMEIQTVVRDETGKEIIGFARMRKPTPNREAIEISIGTPGGSRSWVMSVGEAVDIKQQLVKALHHLSNRPRERKADKKKVANEQERMDIT
jgi:hypothetical protein